MGSEHDLAATCERLVQVARDGVGTWSESDVAVLTAALRDAPAAVAPARLVARPAGRSAGDVHARGVLEAVADRGEVARARALHHARFLLHALAPHDPMWAPRVSVVIPVYEAAEWVAAAVQSAIEQTHVDVEVVLVDDGSTDHPERVLAPLFECGREVHLVRQENRGAAAARNTGIAQARGDWIHFLDADDTLHPEAVSRKLAALFAVPDADLCVSRYRSIGADSGSRGAHGPGFGDALCPTRDLLATWVHRYPFQTSTVLVPRWLLLETGPFEEDFVQGEDARYWFRLALREAKVAALDEPLADRRFRAGSLSASESALGPILFGMALVALLEDPARWPYVGPLAVRMQGRRRWQWLDAHEDVRLEARRDALLEVLDDLPQRALDAGLAAAVPTAVLWREAVHATPHHADGFLARLDAALRSSAARSLPLSAEDVALWLGSAPAPENAAATEWCLDELVARARCGALPVERRELTHLKQRIPGDPRAAALARLGRAPVPWLGEALFDAARLEEPGPRVPAAAAAAVGLDVVVVPDFTGPGAAVFEARTRVFLGSWMEHTGASRDWPLHLVCIGEAPASVRELAERAGAHLHRAEPVEPQQPYLNKLRGLEVPSRSGRILLLDADTVVLGDLSPALALGEAFAALPAATNRLPDPVWERVFAACGAKPPAERMHPLIAEMRDELPESVMREPFREEIPLHWNSGVVLAPVGSGLREAWEEAARTLASAFAGSEWERHVCGNDQPSLAVAAAVVREAGVAYRPLPPLLHGFDLFYASGRLSFEDTRIYHAKTFLRRAKDGNLDLLRECDLYRGHQLPRLYPETRVAALVRRLRRQTHPRRADSVLALCDRLGALVRRYALDRDA